MLRISRKVVRKVIRSEATEFHYERGAQPLPRIGPWQDELDQLLTANEAKVSRERLTLIRIFEELRSRGYEGGYGLGATLCAPVAARSGVNVGGRLRAAELRAGRGLPVRLEP